MTFDEVTILLVDDDAIDRVVVKRVFRKSQYTPEIVEVENGIEALEFLRGTNGKTQLKEPLLVLLDLNMPKMGGIELLKELRQDVDLCKTVVIVLTTSGHEQDRRAAAEVQVAGYMLKDQLRIDSQELVAMAVECRSVADRQNATQPDRDASD